MLRSNGNLWTGLFAGLMLGAMSCGGPASTDNASEQAELADETAVVLGDQATIRLEDGSTIHGIAISVQKRDGTKIPAIFRGPSKLASVTSDGTFVFDGDPLPTRVRLVGPGEEISPRNR